MVSSLLAADKQVEFHIGAGEAAEDLTDAGGRLAGRLVRQWDGLDGVIRLHAERVAGPFQALRLRVQVENTTAPGAPPRTRDGRPARCPDRCALPDRGAGRDIPVHDRPA